MMLVVQSFLWRSPMKSRTRKRRISLIPQKHSTGCGIACVAMVSGVSYRRALKATFPHGIKKDYLTGYADLKRGIAALGGKHAPRAHNAPSSWGRIECTSIVRVNERANGNWHWVVFDAEQRVLLDPGPGIARHIRQPRRKMTSCLKC